MNGLWMNVWGPGCIRDEEEALGAYKGRPPFAIDLKAGTAIIPGDASQKVVVTKTQDVGRFVAAALDLAKWEPESRIVGDKLSFTEVAQLAKTICGRDLRITNHVRLRILMNFFKATWTMVKDFIISCFWGLPLAGWILNPL